MEPSILITGGSGFVGQAIIRSGLFKNPIYISRREISGVKNSKISELNTTIDYKDILRNVDVIIHCAGIAHNNDKPNFSHNSFNADFTQYFANQAVKSGVKQFILLSTAKVLGEETSCCKPFTNESIGSPKTAYSKSKLLAEECLISECEKSTMAFTIIRPPLIYGLEPKGNLKTLTKLIKYSIPLPVARVRNCRSMVSVDDLVEFIYRCSFDKKSWGKKYLISDGIDYSTEYLVKLMAKNQKLKAKIYWFPQTILKFIFHMIGKNNLYASIYGSFKLEVDTTQNMLGWKPSRKLADYENTK